jgi:hypothetical protein
VRDRRRKRSAVGRRVRLNPRLSKRSRGRLRKPVFRPTIGDPRSSTIRNLIASGSDVNIRGDDGCTALHVAALKGRLDVISILLELGGDPNIKNALGETAAQSAQRIGHSEMAAILRTDSAG